MANWTRGLFGGSPTYDTTNTLSNTNYISTATFDELQRRQLEQLKQNMGGANHTIPYPNYNMKPTISPMMMIYMRLGAGDTVVEPFDFLDAFIDANSEKAFVFVVHKGKSVTLEDEKGLFPSDTLITQLRLIGG